MHTSSTFDQLGLLCGFVGVIGMIANTWFAMKTRRWLLAARPQWTPARIMQIVVTMAALALMIAGQVLHWPNSVVLYALGIAGVAGGLAGYSNYRLARDWELKPASAPTKL